MKDLIVLACLASGRKHGYQIKKEMGLIFADERLHNNVVYPLLHRFKQKGWVSRRNVAGQRGQRRFEYTLTTKGRKALVERLASYPDGDNSPEAFYLRVGLFGLLTAAIRELILAVREQRLRGEAAYTKRLESAFDLEGYSAEVVRLIGRKAKLELDWIRRLRKKFATH